MGFTNMLIVDSSVLFNVNNLNLKFLLHASEFIPKFNLKGFRLFFFFFKRVDQRPFSQMSLMVTIQNGITISTATHNKKAEKERER